MRPAEAGLAVTECRLVYRITSTGVLECRMTRSVTLPIAPSGFLTASASQLTFTPDNWSAPQSVTLTSENDRDDVNLWREIVHTSTADGFIAGHLKVLVESR